jgi:hypothetical protein
MIHKLRHSWIAATFAHHMRYGRCADDNHLLGVEVKSVVFRITASDSQALAAALHEERVPLKIDS